MSFSKNGGQEVKTGVSGDWCQWVEIGYKERV
jgi:hypothetical protein